MPENISVRIYLIGFIIFVQVLSALPWRELNIRVLMIETNHVPEGAEAVKQLLEANGYTFFRRWTIDDVFYREAMAEDLDLTFT